VLLDNTAQIKSVYFIVSKSNDMKITCIIRYGNIIKCRYIVERNRIEKQEQKNECM